MARAVERLSGGELAAVPACGEWTVPALRGCRHRLQRHITVHCGHLSLAGQAGRASAAREQ
ncbi:DUF6885 family protein [Prauserella shujinwangii]|uniref:DUF6885 family protein n=1 Tax=Prauserella shujinwangii TaxID=1453103 RepID=UPI0031840B23